MSQRTVLKVVGCVVGVALLGALVSAYVPAARFIFVGLPSDASIAKLKEQGQLIVDALEQYRSTNGRYPASLSKVVSDYGTRYGSWKYEVAKDGMSFSLHVCEYMKHKLELWWYSTRGDWVLDT